MLPNHVNQDADIESRPGTISGDDACLELHRRRKAHRVGQQQSSHLRLRMKFSVQETFGVGADNRELQVIVDRDGKQCRRISQLHDLHDGQRNCCNTAGTSTRAGCPSSTIVDSQ